VFYIKFYNRRVVLFYLFIKKNCEILNYYWYYLYIIMYN